MLHVGAATALGPADAVLDAERALAPIHIESPANPDCTFHHGHLFCQMLRSLSFAGVPRNIDLANPQVPPFRLADRILDASHVKSTPIMSGSVIPRGPPVA